MQKRRRMWGWVFVAPQFIGLLIFALIPLVMSFVISFHDWASGGGDDSERGAERPLFRPAPQRGQL